MPCAPPLLRASGSGCSNGWRVGDVARVGATSARTEPIRTAGDGTDAVEGFAGTRVSSLSFEQGQRLLGAPRRSDGQHTSIVLTQREGTQHTLHVHDSAAIWNSGLHPGFGIGLGDSSAAGTPRCSVQGWRHASRHRRL